MKQFLKKPLGLAVAATLAMGGMAAFTNANAATDASALGDAAIVPYYTVKGNFITGIQVLNTSAHTVVAKVRLRRDTDSADVLDFNVVLSPYDVWNGYVDDSSGRLSFSTTDNTCTAPTNAGTLLAPTDAQGGNLTGAEEGYIEVIGMAQAADPDSANADQTAVAILARAEGQLAPTAAKHNGDTPLDCNVVEDNFLAANVTAGTATKVSNTYSLPATLSSFNATRGTVWGDVAADALKVTYFIRDGASGMEFGDNATHLKDFSKVAMMTNQEAGQGLSGGNTNGFDFPDLDGGGSLTAGALGAASVGSALNRGTATGSYNAVVRADLGAASIMNHWSYNTSNNVATDWVVTVPGQYLMIDPKWVAGNGEVLGVNTDIPLTATLTIYDREEKEKKGGEVVVSPGQGNAKTSFPNEVNVVQWGGKSVFNSENVVSADPFSSGITQQFGWASLSLQSSTNANANITGLLIYDLTDTTGIAPTAANDGTVTAVQRTDHYAPQNHAPVIGFTAWQRKFSTAEKNYGRIVGHSRK